MKHLFLLLILTVGVNGYSSFAQTAATSTLKDRIIGKWTYEGTEEFGVLTAADSTQKNDMVEFTSDMKYTKVTGGKKETGIFKVTESTRQVFLTADDSKKTAMYKVKSATAAGIILDFQTPDLVHTLYRYKK